jgi:D-alanyl-D-alanine carboxypeptidase/D-alanyl-D-alanine-endopeptidase (penicillin-binding protein 4)
VKPDYQKATLLLEDQVVDARVDHRCVPEVEPERVFRNAVAVAGAGGQRGTFDAGLKVVRDTLAKWGVPPETYVARDGSGLSRNDYLSPEVLVRLLTVIWRDPRHLEPFRAALPVGGISGTIAERLKDTPAQGRVFAKTGSMSNVRSLSGYLMTLDNEPLVFSFMATGFHVPSSQIDAAMDQALLRLVRYPRDAHEE